MNSAGIARRRCAIPRVIAPAATLGARGEPGSRGYPGPRVLFPTGIAGEMLSGSRRAGPNRGTKSGPSWH